MIFICKCIKGSLISLAEKTTRGTGTRCSGDFHPNGYPVPQKSPNIGTQAWCPLSLFLSMLVNYALKYVDLFKIGLRLLKM
jgi:hypothetical protein